MQSIIQAGLKVVSTLKKWVQAKKSLQASIRRGNKGLILPHKFIVVESCTPLSTMSIIINEIVILRIFFFKDLFFLFT